MRLRNHFALLTTTLVLAFLLSYVGAGFADNGAAGQYRIGVVDRKAVYDAYQRQVDEMARLDAEVNQREQQIASMIDELDQKRSQLQQNQTNLNSDQRLQLQDELERDMMNVRNQRDEWQRQLERRADRLITSIRNDIDEVIQELGVENNYHLIMEGDANLPSGVLYFSSTLNMTGQVIDRLNSQYSGS